MAKPDPALLVDVIAPQGARSAEAGIRSPGTRERAACRRWRARRRRQWVPARDQGCRFSRLVLCAGSSWPMPEKERSDENTFGDRWF
jgi:hypothetical protein